MLEPVQLSSVCQVFVGTMQSDPEMMPLPRETHTRQVLHSFHRKKAWYNCPTTYASAVASCAFVIGLVSTASSRLPSGSVGAYPGGNLNKMHVCELVVTCCTKWLAKSLAHFFRDWGLSLRRLQTILEQPVVLRGVCKGGHFCVNFRVFR
jgi:hypothetical protein